MNDVDEGRLDGYALAMSEFGSDPSSEEGRR
jgi:hypothetical protein